MAERLAATGGIVPEFVNPKWADAERPGPGPWPGMALGASLCRFQGLGDLWNIYGEYPLVILHSYGKSPFLIGKSTINGNFQ